MKDKCYNDECEFLNMNMEQEFLEKVILSHKCIGTYETCPLISKHINKGKGVE